MYLERGASGDGAGAAGGGFAFDPAGLEAVLKDWTRLKDELLQDAQVARPLTQVRGPGREPASENMAAVAGWSGLAFSSHNQAMLQIVQTYIDNLTKARDAYLVQDEAARATYRGGQA